MFKSSFLKEARERGFLYQSTDLMELDEFLSSGPKTAYVGFDLTAKSLHVGHLIPIFLLRLFQRHGHTPIVLVGGGTTKIGDPSFKNTTRPILTDEQISENLAGIRECLSSFINFEGENAALIVNNADWLDQLEYIPFLRDIGRLFSVNKMITFESVKAKLTPNNTLSFLEFNYMIMQAYDFYKLFEQYGCAIQLGGQDQWGNMVCGIDLIHKKTGKDAFILTCGLLTTSDGQKMGKTANGAVWLSPSMISAYDFWQYWRNVDDRDLFKLMYLFSELPINKIKELEADKNQDINDFKKLLADQVTSIIWPREELEKIHKLAEGFFAKSSDISSIIDSAPQIVIKKQQLEKEISIIDVLFDNKICTSKGEAKRLLRANGIYINGEPVEEDFVFTSNIKEEILKLSCGKKKHFLIRLK